MVPSALPSGRFGGARPLVAALVYFLATVAVWAGVNMALQRARPVSSGVSIAVGMAIVGALVHSRSGTGDASDEK